MTVRHEAMCTCSRRPAVQTMCSWCITNSGRHEFVANRCVVRKLRQNTTASCSKVPASTVRWERISCSTDGSLAIWTATVWNFGSDRYHQHYWGLAWRKVHLTYKDPKINNTEGTEIRIYLTHILLFCKFHTRRHFVQLSHSTRVPTPRTVWPLRHVRCSTDPTFSVTPHLCAVTRVLIELGPLGHFT